MASTTSHTSIASASAEPALDVIRLLASEIGPRRPCSEAEAAAGKALVAWLGGSGVDAQLESFRGYTSFAHPYALMLGASLAGGLLQARHGWMGTAISSAALAALLLEGDLRLTPVSDLLSREPSANVVASVAPRGEERSGVCLCGHMDSTRYGLLFHPQAVKRLQTLLAVPSLSALVLAAAPLVRRLPAGRVLRGAAIGGLALSLAVIAERELRGEDVPGASDNASGAGVAAQLIVEAAARPLENTRVDLLITGCEEAGMLGAQAYLRSHPDRAAGTTFLNFDTVGGDVPLTYILHEGMVPRRASARLVGMLEQIAASRPELGLRPARSTPGLPTDAAPALARGYEAVTLLAQGACIPHYHQPSDTYENVHLPTVERTLGVGRELLARLDAEA